MQTPITIEAAAVQFNEWRQSKISKFEPIPDNLKNTIMLLIPHYPKNQIIKHLKLNSTTIKPYFSDKHNNKTEQTIDFVPFQITPTINQNHLAVNPKQIQSSNTVCQIQITKQNGQQLVIQTTDPKSIIQAFLCCN